MTEDERKKLYKEVSGAIKSTINIHGPIDSLLVTSVTKRIVGAISNLKEKNEHIS